MKNRIQLVTLTFFLIANLSFGQKKIAASDIMKNIKEGKTISYNNAIIEGVIDFTFMKEAMVKLQKQKNSWWSSDTDSDNKVEKTIANNISFINCTFKDDVLAYIPDENSGYTFTASFENEVIFNDCTFERKAMFKYSDFDRNTTFKGSRFEDDSTFKYAEFKKDISFEKAFFKASAAFKYTKFKNYVTFLNSVFKETASFKYAKFDKGVSFQNAKFEEDLIIKYTEITGDFNITGMNVAHEIDSKYTKINGSEFNKKHLLKRTNKTKY
jgi:hypothetical protein